MQHEEKLKSNLRALFDAYCAATGLKPTTVGNAVAADMRFYAERVVGERNFTVRVYDQVVGRFVTIWPKGTKWPAGVPRARPCELPDGVAGRFASHAKTQEGRENGKEAQA